MVSDKEDLTNLVQESTDKVLNRQSMMEQNNKELLHNITRQVDEAISLTTNSMGNQVSSKVDSLKQNLDSSMESILERKFEELHHTITETMEKKMEQSFKSLETKLKKQLEDHFALKENVENNEDEYELIC